MAPHSRFKSAVQAMRDIGIPSKTVKPVLRKLLEVYEDNWALIQEESYRTLADAIFEQQHSDAVAIEEPPSALPSSSSVSCRESPSSSKRPMLEEPPPLRRRSQLRLEEPPSSPCQFSAPRLTYSEASSSKEPALEEEPLKRRSRLRSEKACGSPAVPPPTSPYVEASSFKRLASESAVSPHSREKPVSVDGAANSNSFKRRKIEPSHVDPFPISSINDPVRCSHPNANEVLNDSGHATSPQRPSIPPVEDGNNPVQHSNHQNLQMPKLEPFVDDYPAVAVEVPLSVIHLSGHESSEEDCANRLDDSLQALSTIYEDDDDDHNENVRNSTVPNKKKEHLTDSAPEDSLSYEIASTSLGEVKLAISCNCSYTSQDFHVPSLDVVMKLAEDRALKSYKILGSSFSIMKLMKEICQCFLELATGAGEQQKRITTVTPEINMSKLSKDHILAAAVVMNNIPQGATQVLVCGTLTKTGYAVVRALCQRGTKVFAITEEELQGLKSKVPAELHDRLELVHCYDCKVWLVGDGLCTRVQRKAPKGTLFVPFSQFPPTAVRSDCTYHTTPAMAIPKALENVHSCENWLPRRVMSAWRIAGIVHALEGWDTHECGEKMLDMKEVLDAAISHGFRPLEVARSLQFP